MSDSAHTTDQTTNTVASHPANRTPVSRRIARPKVPPFARYKGTSAWHKSRKRIRAYAWFLAHNAKAEASKA